MAVRLLADHPRGRLRKKLSFSVSCTMGVPHMHICMHMIGICSSVYVCAYVCTLLIYALVCM